MKTHAKVLFTLITMLLLACLLVACTPSDTPPEQSTASSDTTGGTQAPTLSECEKNGHTEVTDPAVAATCSKTGLTEGKHCSVCNAVIVAQTETPIDPDAHTEVIDQAVAATCQATGLTEGKHCSDCNAVIVEQTEIPQLEYHTYQNGICTGCKEPQTQGLKYTLYDNSYYGVAIGSCKSNKIYIPAEYAGLPVTEIRSKAFQKCTYLTSIVIPDSITYIGERAFYGCSNLTNIVLPDSITYISNNVFKNCTNLTYNIYDNAKYLGNEQNPYFALITATDTSITSCEMHPQTRMIASQAFNGCSSLTSVTIGNNITRLNDYTFSNCSLTSITIPDGVTSISNGAFHGCSSLTSITVSEGNPVYHANGNCLIETATKTLIAGCSASIIPTDGSVTNIGEAAFYSCSNLTSITIPDSVTSIGSTAFFDCDSLTSVTIGNSVTSIESHAFAYCNNLTNVTIGNGVKSIGDSAFLNCWNLTNITFTGTQAEWNAITTGNNWNDYCPATVVCTG